VAAGVHVDELRGAGDGELVLHLPAQEIIEVVREKEAARGEIGDSRATGDGLGELEAGVVKDVGDARGGVDAVGALNGEFLQARLRAVVAVGVRWENETAGIVEQHMIAAPGIHADGGELRALGQERGGLPQAGGHFMPEGAELPIGVGAEFPVGVGETVGLGEGELVLGPGAEDDAAAGGAEIDGSGVEGFGHGESGKFFNHE
jgi:hypothetical protein